MILPGAALRQTMSAGPLWMMRTRAPWRPLASVTRRGPGSVWWCERAVLARVITYRMGIRSLLPLERKFDQFVGFLADGGDFFRGRFFIVAQGHSGAQFGEEFADGEVVRAFGNAGFEPGDRVGIIIRDVLAHDLLGAFHRELFVHGCRGHFQRAQPAAE